MRPSAVVLAFALAAALAAAQAAAGAPPGAGPAEALAAFDARSPMGEPDCPDAAFSRAFREGLAARSGPQVGWKAGLTTAAAQARFGADGPLLGALFADMILPDGAHVRADFGARPMWEADLLLVVGEGIEAATDARSALAAVRGLRPFIELPDLMYAPEVRLDAARLAAVNVGARLGVAGAEVALADDDATFAALGAMRVAAYDGDGGLLAEGRGSDVLGHPLQALLWVRDAAARAGRPLRPGDLVSVGAFTPLTPPKQGQTVTVRYEGLPGEPSTTVRFR